MKLKIDRGLLPIKAHFFFFFAALGPILPQLNVFGRQLGVSPAAMGMVTAVLPLLWALAKPLFGYVVDFWPAHRKLVFMLLIATMSGSYCCLWLLPMPEPIDTGIIENVYHLNDTIYMKKYQNTTSLEKYTCHWNCSLDSFDVYLTNDSDTYVNTVYVAEDVRNTSCSLLYMELDEVREGEVICLPKSSCNLMCYEDKLILNRNKRNIDSKMNDNFLDSSQKDRVTFSSTVEAKNEDNFYMTVTFWAFVVLMCVGTVAFNVANCIGDAVCFDVLGPERASKYGAQRAWGTVGYGLTALAGGCLIDLVSGTYKDFTPAFAIALVATVVDLYSCRKLTLPSLSSPADSGKALREVLKIPRVLVFITFAVVAGTFDSFIIYYMFWFLEELAEQTGHSARIKLIEGVVVAAQSFVGELLFFYFSGKIIKRWGYGTTLTLSLLCYGVRMALISTIQQPWHLVFIEAIMQGPTYALCYSTIVGYAAHVAPEGYSATVQGIVAGMDDGLGFAIGSLLGGQLYSRVGGRSAFRLFAGAAAAASLLHAALFALTARSDGKKPEESIRESDEAEDMLPDKHAICRTDAPSAGQMRHLPDSLAVYRDTVLPLKEAS